MRKKQLLQIALKGPSEEMVRKAKEEKTLGLKMKSMGLCITVTEKSKMENISYG